MCITVLLVLFVIFLLVVTFLSSGKKAIAAEKGVSLTTLRVILVCTWALYGWAFHIFRSIWRALATADMDKLDKYIKLYACLVVVVLGLGIWGNVNRP